MQAEVTPRQRAEATLSERQSELYEMITRWAEERKILAPNEVLEISVKINKVQPVVISIQAHQFYKGTAHVDAMTIGELELSVRATNCLDNVGLKTVGEIRKKTLADMRKYRNFGTRSLREIDDRLRKLGVKLNWFPANPALDAGMPDDR